MFLLIKNTQLKINQIKTELNLIKNLFIDQKY